MAAQLGPQFLIFETMADNFLNDAEAWEQAKRWKAADDFVSWLGLRILSPGNGRYDVTDPRLTYLSLSDPSLDLTYSLSI